MFPRYSIISIVILFSYVCGQEGDDIDAVIASIFSRNVTQVTSSPRPDSQASIIRGETGEIPGTGSCTCVPYYLCKDGSINTNGEGVIDIRSGAGPCENYLDTCCGEGSTVTEPITPAPASLKLKRVGCGYRNPDGNGFRITGNKDHEAEFAEFPWMAAILNHVKVGDNPKSLVMYKCGGALIHPQVVLTTAHCVADKTMTFKIRLGEWDTQTEEEIFPHQDRNVSSITIHPNFYSGALHNDIALLFLASPVEIAENVNVACLPPQSTVIDNARCYVTGWGKDVYGKTGRYQTILKKMDLPIVPKSPCQEALRKTRLGRYFYLHQSFICAGGEEGIDACQGDGGSPLVCPITGQEDRYVQVGMVAWGIGCGTSNVPGVYANVAQFRNWIDAEMGQKNFDTSSYQY